MTAEPIVEFKNTQAARESLKEWQRRLYLDDWIFLLSLVEPSEELDNQGIAEIDSVHKAAIIRIAKLDGAAKDRIVKICHEVTLVHELVHCMFDSVDNHGKNETPYGICYDRSMHNLIDTVARSLIMAKYGIGPEWFNNVPEADDV
jgi:hypothetical protein